MQGPPDTPYEKGAFELYCHFGPDYPVKPPLVRFVTQVSCQNTNICVFCICRNTHIAVAEVYSFTTDKVMFSVRKFFQQNFLNMMTGVPLQCEHCGPHLPQHI